MSFRSKGFLFLPVAALLYLAACAPVPVKEGAPGPAGPLPPGKIRGRVATGNLPVSLAGAEVRLGTAKGYVNKDGAFSFPDAPSGKQTLVVEKRFPSGKIRRVLGLTTLYVGEAPVEVGVKVADATDVDSFCLDCHPPLKQVTRKDQIFRDIHVSGVVAKRGNADRSLLDEDGKVTCESCHTLHQPGFPKYGVGDIKSGAFCNRCHGGP